MVGINYKFVLNEKKYWEFIRILRNDPEIQHGFVEQVNITSEEQEKYMEKHNNNYYIALSEDGEPMGYVGEIEDDIRVAVAAKFQRKGVGKFLINELMKLRPNSYAKVKILNTPSQRLFESCGFVNVRRDNKFYYYQKH